MTLATYIWAFVYVFRSFGRERTRRQPKRLDSATVCSGDFYEHFCSSFAFRSDSLASTGDPRRSLRFPSFLLRFGAHVSCVKCVLCLKMSFVSLEQSLFDALGQSAFLLSLCLRFSTEAGITDTWVYLLDFFPIGFGNQLCEN
jgi:hypothetical protein